MLFCVNSLPRSLSLWYKRSLMSRSQSNFSFHEDRLQDNVTYDPISRGLGNYSLSLLFVSYRDLSFIY